MYGSYTYGQSEYGGFHGIVSPLYFPALEVFTISEVLVKASVTKTAAEIYTINEAVGPSRTYTYLENYTYNDVLVRPVLNGQTATWIRIPRDRTTWNSLPKN